MDWIERLNQAIVYMEEHMTEEIDYAQAAKIAHCSSFHFQRMFSYIADVPLSEYIRRRKMSLAAVDLQGGSEKIIDIALKYGYSSPTAFNRAFQSIHGIAPSQAKEEGATLKSYPPISFKLIAKGVEEMEFRIEKKDAIRILGVSAPLSDDATTAYEEAEALWIKTFTDGAPKDTNGDLLDVGTICNELNAACDTKRPELNGFLGVEIERNDSCEYMIAVASTLPEHGSLKEYIIPAHTWAVFPGKNFFAEEYAESEVAIKFEERVYSEWLPTSGYEIADGLDVHLLFATSDLENAPFERWIPVKKLAEKSYG
ncbi:MAG: AraC family transcriptional regulator [Oscillospiraceae bacterium]|nr:AraC family transcriptional regulator [Oscillospiraceae bacterium]